MITAHLAKFTADHSTTDRADERKVARHGAVRIAMTLALAMLVFSVWAVMHRYGGLNRDARAYALQALARLEPNLHADLFFQNASQDRYTIFSPVFSLFAKILGLENSALLLTVVCTIWLLAASWALAKRIGGYAVAWLSVALLVIVRGDYGAYGVFCFPEPYLTARLPACALIVTAMAMHMAGRRRSAFAVGASALVVHPIMALPGCLVLLAMILPLRICILAAMAGVASATALALGAEHLPFVARLAPVMDPAWLEVVRGRAVFLFLQQWPAHDWLLNTRPFVSLTLSALLLPRARTLCSASLLVGAAGLAVAYVGSVVGPNALLVEGQGWRWEWITCFIAVLLVPQTLMQLWEARKSGPLCAAFLLLSWTFSPIDGTACAAAALAFWLVRGSVSEKTERGMRWAAGMLMLIVLVWVAATTWNIVTTLAPESGRESSILTKARNIFGLEISACAAFACGWWWIVTRRRAASLIILCVALTTLAALVLRKSFEQIEPIDTEGYLAEFADWRAVIPPTSTVLVAPPQDSGRLVWFSLRRPQYLSADQSAGVVFSRATAVEVKRRSAVLLPIEDPSWKDSEPLSDANPAGIPSAASHTRPLTTRVFRAICRDPQLGFVMSKELLDVAPVRTKTHGRWKGWSLYDCRAVRFTTPSV